MNNGLYEPTQFEWITNIDGSLHGYDPEDLYNLVCQTALWRAESLTTSIGYNPEDIATTLKAHMQLDVDWHYGFCLILVLMFFYVFLNLYCVICSSSVFCFTLCLFLVHLTALNAYLSNA